MNAKYNYFFILKKKHDLLCFIVHNRVGGYKDLDPFYFFFLSTGNLVLEHNLNKKMHNSKSYQ